VFIARKLFILWIPYCAQDVVAWFGYGKLNVFVILMSRV